MNPREIRLAHYYSSINCMEETHPKVLGALINQLGLDRQVFGDIILDEEGRVQFSIASHLASYAIMTITKIGNVSVTLKEVS